MTNPYDPPPKQQDDKRRWLTARFAIEFVIGGVIGFFFLCLLAVFVLCGGLIS